ncbi:MAG: DUF1801 domain-containing protein [Nitrosomonadales bacterium]|nr:DUF1801 domain-containing protein [Nitrosomonadales bacterium]
MKPSRSTPATIDEYIASFPTEVQAMLGKLRQTIRKIAPDAAEKISYRIPTFYLNGNLVHFAAFKHHIGFYPTSSGVSAFQDELSKYRASKGAIQFPFDQPLPLNLIERIVAFRVKENARKRVKSKK